MNCDNENREWLITTVRKAGLKNIRVCDSGHRKVSVVRITHCPYKAG